MTAGVDVPTRVSVIGAGAADPAELEAARALGRALGREGAVLVCGGLGGVMDAAARGCSEAGGVTVGLLPGPDAWAASPWIRIPLATAMGQARNALVARAGEVVLAVGGGWGTLSEIALARKAGRDVGLLGAPLAADSLDLPRFEDAAEAAAWAMERALARRGEAPSR